MHARHLSDNCLLFALGHVRDCLPRHCINPELNAPLVHRLQREDLLGWKVTEIDIAKPSTFPALYTGEKDLLCLRWLGLLKEKNQERVKTWSDSFRHALARQLALKLCSLLRALRQGRGPAETERTFSMECLTHIAVLTPVWNEGDAGIRPVLLSALAKLEKERKEDSDSIDGDLPGIIAHGLRQGTLLFCPAAEYGGLQHAIVLVCGFTDPLYLRRRFKRFLGDKHRESFAAR